MTCSSQAASQLALIYAAVFILQVAVMLLPHLYLMLSATAALQNFFLMIIFFLEKVKKTKKTKTKLNEKQ